MGTYDCIFIRNRLKNVDEIVSKMFKSYILLIDDLEKLFPYCQLALFSMVNGLAKSGRFSFQVKHLDTTEISKKFNRKIAKYCENKNFRYIE